MNQNQPHIVFIVATYDYPSPRVIRIKHLVPYLKKQYRITILTLNSSGKQVQSEVVDGTTVIRVPYGWISRYITNRQFSDKQLTGFLLQLSRVFSFVLKRWFLFPDPWVTEQDRLVRAMSDSVEAPDVLVASMLPFSMADVLFKYRNSANLPSAIPVVLDIGDPLAHNVVNESRRVRPRVLHYESRLLTMSNHVIVTNTATANHYADEFKLDPTSVSVIPQGAKVPGWIFEDERFSNSQSVDLRYAGLFIENIRDPRLLFSHLRPFDKSIKLTVCGAIDQCFMKDSEHINFKGLLSDHKVAEFYKQADCLLFFDNKKGLQTSGKIYELLATRKPLLFCYDNEQSPVKKVCEKYGHILFIKNEASEIEKGLNNLANFIGKALEWLSSNEGQDYSTYEFSWHERSVRYSVVIDNLLKNPV